MIHSVAMRQEHKRVKQPEDGVSRLVNGKYDVSTTVSQSVKVIHKILVNIVRVKKNTKLTTFVYYK